MAVCVHLNSEEFKRASKKLNLSERYLEPIVHKFINTAGNSDSFPSDSYIIEQLTPKPISGASASMIKLWKDYYSSPVVFNSLNEFNTAVETAISIFGSESVVPIERADGTFELRVGTPNESGENYLTQQKQSDTPINIASLEFYSGGAIGSDSYWASEIEKHGGKVKHYRVDDYDSLSQSEKNTIEEQYKEVVKLLGRKELPIDSRGKLVRRDMMQANSADAIFAVGTLEYSFVTGKAFPAGGTAYAVARAILDGKPVYFFDQAINKWNYYNKDTNSWEIVGTPVLTKKAAVIGTRDLESSGKKAIENAVNKTIGIKNDREFTFNDGVTVETPFKLNQQQEAALNAMNDFISSSETHMTLSGYAGTGKTSLMEILADKVENDGRRIIFSATTNKAAAVLKSKVSKLGFPAYTLNKVFGIGVEVDSSKEYNARDLIKQLRDSELLHGGEIVVIDEASMIDEGNYEILNTIARAYGLKIIYVGDKAQLAPVKETQISKVFRDNTGRIAELTQVERTADNAILKEATNIRNGKALSGESSFNSRGEGVAYVRQGNKNTVASIVRHFVQGLRNDPNHFRILAYTNAMVAKYNEAVRRTLGYNDNTPRVGEPMVGYNNWGYIRGGGYRFVNSEAYKVVDIGGQNTKSITAGGKTYKFTTIPITLEDSLGKTDTFDYIDIKANSDNKQGAVELAKLKSTLWEQYRKNFSREGRAAILGEIRAIDNFLFVNDDVTEGKRTLQSKIIDFGYALTIHKSQGSTFTHVLMDDVDVQKADAAQSSDLSNIASINLEDESAPDYSSSEILSEENIDLGEDFSAYPQTSQPQENKANIKQQLEYVGVSRATTTVTIISNDVKTEDSPLNHLNKIQSEQVEKTENYDNLFNKVTSDAVETEDKLKPWKDNPEKSNPSRRFYLKGRKEKGYFELVKDEEDNNYSVHFKPVEDKNPNAFSQEEKTILFQALADAIPEGASVSTWGTVSKGGIAGLNRFEKLGFVKTGEREVHMKGSGEAIHIPIFTKTKEDTKWSRTSDNNFEVSTAGTELGKKFSALNAKFKENTIIDGIDVSGKTIEDVYQNIIKKSGKGRAPATFSRLSVLFRGYATKINKKATTLEETVGNTASDYVEGVSNFTPRYHFTSSFEEAEGYAKNRTDKSEEEFYKDGKLVRQQNRHYTGDFAQVGSYHISKGAKIAVFEDFHDLNRNSEKANGVDIIILKRGTLDQSASEFIVSREGAKYITELSDTSKETLQEVSYQEAYLPLWQEWAKQNPELIEQLREASKGKVLTDKFASTAVSQARALADILNGNVGIPERIEPQIATEEETKEIFNDNQSVREELQQFQDENSRDTRELNTLFNSAKLSNSEVRYVAKQLVFGISDFITDCLETPSKYLECFPELFANMTEEQKAEEIKKIGNMTRLEFFKYATPQRVLQNVSRKMFFPVSKDNPNGNPNLNTIKKISRAKIIASNLNGLMRLANDAFVISEDFSIVYTRERNEVSDTLNTINDDVNNEDDKVAELGKTLENWQFEFRTQDAITRMSQLVKRVLGRSFEYTVDKDGNYKQVSDEWGIAKRVDMLVASSSIVTWVRGAMSLSEMVSKLKEKEKENPWIHQIISMLEDTSGKNSDFQSQFYAVFSQSFQPYSIVKREIGENGEYEYKTLTLNERPARKKAFEDLKAAYQLNTIPLFNNGEVNTQNADLLESISNQLVEMSNKGIEQSDWLKIIDLVHKATTILGYEATIEEIAPTISNNAALTKIANAFQNIALNVKKAVGMTGYAPFKYNSKNGIGGFVQSALDVLTSKKEETAISAIYDNGKMYQSNVIPSYLTRLLSKFREKDDAKLQEFIENEYGAYSWFKNQSGWKNMVLRDFLRASAEEREKLFRHKVQLNFNKHNYMKDLTENELALSVLTEYASGLINAKGNVIPTWFKVPMLSNKPSSEFISLNAYVGDMVETKLLQGFAMIFTQELARIQTVRLRDYDKDDPEFIKNFDKNGKKFMFLDFFNKYLTTNKNSELGKLINKALEEGTSYNINANKGLREEENTRLNILVKEEIKDVLNKRAQTVVESWKSNGVFEAAKQIQGFSKDDAVLERQLKDFVWNDTFAAMNILEFTVTDIAFYKDAEDLQKRFAQIHAPGTKANVEARDYEGKRVSDGNFRTFLLKDFDDFVSNIVENLSIVFDRKIEEAKKSGEYTEAMRAFYDDILNQYKKINVADAQGYSSPTSYRKKAFLFGRWSVQAEEIYKKLSSNNYNYADLKTAFQPLKPFVYGQINKPAFSESGMSILLNSPMSNLKVPVQFKNSEYLLIMADAILRGENTGKPNLLRAVYNIMEDSAKENPETCIDTVQFESTCKSGLMAAIDIKQFYNMEHGEDAAYLYMRDRIYKNGAYNTDVYVYEVPFEYYSIQQEVPAHFREHEQSHGSQIRYIIISDLETVDSDGNPVTYDFVDNGVEKKLSAQEFKEKYEENIALNIKESIDQLSDELGLSDKFLSKKDRNIALSKILIKEIFDSPRYGADLAVACSVNEETGEFNIPLGDPIQSKRIEQLINSVIKNRINKQEVAGGPVVQVSNFGTSKELHIRFNKKGGGLLMTKEEFAKTAPGPKGKYNIDAAYKKYIEDNQDGIAYYEVYAPIYVNELFRQFTDKDGRIDIEAIEEVNPDLLKMIGYRIPTEDKYSMAPLKIVGFLPREAGDGIMLPNEITLITGSDFDVDKFYLMRKDIGIGTKKISEIRDSLYESMDERYKDSYDKRRKLSETIDTFLANPIEMRKADKINSVLWEKYKKLAFNINVPTEGRAYRNNKIIDMSWAVLTNATTVDKIMNPGGFAPEKTMGYMISAYQNPANKFSWEELKLLGDKKKGLLDKKLVDIDPKNKDILVGVDALKDLCYTDKNLCYIDTHLQFYKQNSAAATALGMAAVQKVAHAVLESNGYQMDIEAITGLPTSIDEESGETFLFEIAGFKLRNMMELDAKKNISGALIGRTLGEFVAMFADAVKDPVANLMNINNTMMPYLTTLIRLGMPFEQAAIFLGQPIIKEALSIFNAKNLSGFTSFSNVISELKDNLAKELKVTPESNFDAINSLEESQLIKNLREQDRDKIVDYTILRFLQNISAINESIKPLTYATRFNSISNAVGPLIVDNLIMEFKMNKMNPSEDAMDNKNTNVYNNYGEVVGFDDVLAEHPILEQFARAANIANEIFSDMPTNSAKFRKILTVASEGMRDTLLKDRKLLTELSDFFQSYLLLASGVVKEEGKNQGLKYYIEKFPLDFVNLNAKSVFAGNALIDAIRYDIQKDKLVLKIDTTGMQTQDKEILSDGWVDLYNSGERGQKLAMHLFFYNFFRTGIGFSPKSFMGLFPSRLKDKIEGYVKAFTVNSREFAINVDERVLLDQFIRNNVDNNKLVPKVTLGKDGYKYKVTEDTGEIVIENARDLEDKEYIKIKKNGNFILYKKTHVNPDAHLVSYKEEEILGNNGEYLEISTNKNHKAVTMTSNIIEQTKDNGVNDAQNEFADISLEKSSVSEEEGRKIDRAQRIRNKIVEWFESAGKSAKDVDAYRNKPEEVKRTLAPRMKQFFREKLSEEGIKYDDKTEKLIDEMYDSIC